MKDWKSPHEEFKVQERRKFFVAAVVSLLASVFLAIGLA